MADMVVIHTEGDIDPNTIIAGLPSGRWAYIITSIEYSIETKRGGQRQVHEGLVLTTEKDANVWGYSAKYKVIRPYFNGKSRDASTLYWKGENPREIITSFSKGMGVKGKVDYVDKEGYGFVKLPEDFRDVHVLVGLLRFWGTEESEYNYSFKRDDQVNQRNDHIQGQYRNDHLDKVRDNFRSDPRHYKIGRASCRERV